MDGGRGAARPERAHQVPMAALSAELGIIASEPDPAPGGKKERSAQAWKQARSYVWPEGRITGSAMSAPEIGHTNSGGGASSICCSTTDPSLPVAAAADRAGE